MFVVQGHVATNPLATSVPQKAMLQRRLHVGTEVFARDRFAFCIRFFWEAQAQIDQRNTAA